MEFETALAIEDFVLVRAVLACGIHESLQHRLATAIDPFPRKHVGIYILSTSQSIIWSNMLHRRSSNRFDVPLIDRPHPSTISEEVWIHDPSSIQPREKDADTDDHMRHHEDTNTNNMKTDEELQSEGSDNPLLQSLTSSSTTNPTDEKTSPWKESHVAIL